MVLFTKVAILTGIRKLCGNQFEPAATRKWRSGPGESPMKDLKNKGDDQSRRAVEPTLEQFTNRLARPHTATGK